MAASMNASAMRKLFIGALVLGAVSLGALREFLFLNLNYQLDAVAHNRVISYAHSMFQAWVEGWDLPALLRLKWILALLFVALMALGAILLARVLWGDQRYRRIILFAFGAVGALALLMNALAALHPAFGAISIKLLHSLQYPVLLFFVWAAAILQRNIPAAQDR